MRYLLIILLIGLTMGAAGQTISPLPVAGAQTVVSINGLTYMVAYPSGIPAGADVRVMVSWNGIQETSGIECTVGGWHRTISRGWNMKQRKTDGSYIYWIVLGMPYYGTSTAAMENAYSQPIDALINYFVNLGILDPTNNDNFNMMGLSIGSREWYYLSNYGTHNGTYRTKFRRVLTQSPINISAIYIQPLSDGRYSTFFNTLDPNNGDSQTPPKYAYQLHNRITTGTKRIDSVTIPNCHCNTMWDQAISTTNFDQIPSVSGRNANNNIITWLTDPEAGANVPPTVFAGNDQTITLPTNSATLASVASDPDGVISGILWTKISGPSGGDLSSPVLTTTTVTALQEGVYVYRIQVTDNNGAQSTDDVQITVNAAPVQTIFVPGRKPIMQ